MIVEDQSAATEFMKAPSVHRLTSPVDTIETHISRIFLAGDRAYKMKRAVKLPYADFSTPVLRLAACEKEVELNSRTAPGLYLGVRRITREKDDRIVFDGSGAMIDAVVEMVRFDQQCLFDRMAVAGELTPKLMTEVARVIARFHRTAPIVHSGSGAENMAAVLDINEAGFATSHIFEADALGAFSKGFRDALARHASLLDRREAAGKIRRCHGDLHLRNICLLGGVPRLFDCIEFNDQIATVDILYDLAFLLMDLWHRGHPQFANLVINRYLDESDDQSGFNLLPFFMAVRAAVRAHVTATQVEEGSRRSGKLVAEAYSYFEMARSLLDAKPAQLVAIGGLSGSGKTTVAELLAPKIGTPPGARIVESDRIRKAMHHVPAEARLPATAYRPAVSERVYREMAWRAGVVLAGGGSVVADAVFDNRSNRDLIEKAGRDFGVSFTGVWLNADPDLLRLRVSSRAEGPSDATIAVLSRQLQRPMGEVEWTHIDAAGSPEDIVDKILKKTPPPSTRAGRRSENPAFG